MPTEEQILQTIVHQQLTVFKSALTPGRGDNSLTSGGNSTTTLAGPLTNSGHFGVAQVSNLLYRRFPIGRTFHRHCAASIAASCRLEACATAGWKPARRLCHRPLPPS